MKNRSRAVRNAPFGLRFYKRRPFAVQEVAF